MYATLGLFDVDEDGKTLGPFYERRPGGLYETMLKKLFHMRCVGSNTDIL